MESTTLRSPLDPLLVDDPDDEDRPLADGIALCLSGGGYRAMLFHLGTLWRLNETGYLAQLTWVSSVSGGSIAAATLGQSWRQLEFDDRGVGQRFHELVVDPVRRMGSKTIDVESVLKGVFGRGSVSDRIVDAYRKHLFGDRTLQDLPARDAGPRFVINAANLQSGALMRFSHPYAWDWRVGKIPNPTIPLATAVAASSAFPPFLSPLVLEQQDSDFEPGTGKCLQYPPYTTRIVLSDGGVYDNLGLESAWKRFGTVLVSDGGGKMAPREKPEGDWPRHLLRILDVIDNQVRSLRKRQVIGSYQLQPGDEHFRKGAYWGIRSDIANYGLTDSLPCPYKQTLKLAQIPTRLKGLSDRDQERLINWGYAVCDAAMRRWVDRSLEPSPAFPYPARGVG